ncbi:MAG: TRAP transporter substrate-binding protein DctP [Wenzhouxiangella sp.]|jgi:TRAP-type C4-dicarboxylate transport system substrate-binding protein|nr:TRAP transporter substrate-binding protein DctP [Wenzhouxiangella sp.]
MKQMTLAFLALAALCLAATSDAAQIKLATIAPDGSSWMERMRATADRIEERTDGAVSLRFYPGGVMGDAEAVLRRMRLGQLHGAAFTVGELASVAPVANLYSMPFVFRDVEEVQAVRKTFDPLVIEGLADGGIVAPGISLGGFAYLFSDRDMPTVDPEQMNSGFRVWVPAGDRLSQRTLEEAGATPVPLPLAEVYTALQTGAVNTFASTPSATIILQWHTRAETMLDMPLLMTAGTIGLDQRTVERLPEADRAILLEELRATLEHIEDDNFEDNAEALEALREGGVEILQPEQSLVSFWYELAHRVRRNAVEAGRFELPHLDRLEAELEQLRDGE